MPIEEADIHKHLDFIQLTITRMATNSFLVKGWSVTLVTGLIAFTAEKEKSTAGALIGLLPSILFWGLDAYYLRQERLFRKLYDVIRKKETTDYSLNVNELPLSDLKSVASWPATFFAAVVWPFYLSLIAVILFVWQFNTIPVKASPTKDVQTTTLGEQGHAGSLTSSTKPGPGNPKASNQSGPTASGKTNPENSPK